MTTSIIVAAANNDVIGSKDGRPWYLPAELANFKKITMGHSIIMGRKTHESIGRQLPGRRNIVVTRNSIYKPAEGCLIASSLREALALVKKEDEVFVIGGESIFAEALDIADKVYLTRVNADIGGDVYFHFDSKGWKQVLREPHKADDKNKYDYEFTVWERTP